MAFIVIENPDVNIWEANPALELISGFRKFKKEEGDIRSSNILKAIYYIWDPKSDLRDSGITYDELVNDVTTNMIEDPDFNWDDYEDIKELYMSTNITAVEAKMLAHEKELDDLNKFIRDWTLTKKDIKDRISSLSAFNKLLDEYSEIRDKFKMETEELSEMLGGYQKSFIEDFGKD